MRSPLMKMSWFLSGLSEVPSMRVPARMMVSASWAWAGWEIATRAATQNDSATNFRVRMESLREAGVACSRREGICKEDEFRFGNFSGSGTNPPGVFAQECEFKGVACADALRL